ncbi:unnamed protein product [Phytomonas sp. EM1]|nr:unnamed protein product [Phytomonas sp. EM1]|eukprot:CCW64934.1 unnamed protein product [Phytomonas sp. isolate EM1]
MVSSLPQVINFPLHRSCQANIDNTTTSSSGSRQKDTNRTSRSYVGENASQPSSPDRVSGSDAATIPVKLRCGIRPRELRTIWRIHLQSFPIEYDRAYYRWLSGPDCMSVVALTTPEAYQTMQKSQYGEGPRSVRNKNKHEDLASITQLSVEQLSRIDPPAEGDSIVQRMRAETDEMIRELEDVEEEVERGGMMDANEPSHSKHDNNVTGNHASDDEGGSNQNFSVVIGLAAGELGYARDQGRHLFTNPTCYLCSLAIDPIFRGLGFGGALLDHFLDYVANVPVRASSYLHYDTSRIAEILKTTSSFTKAFIEASHLPNGGNVGIKAWGSADFLREPAGVATPTEGGRKKKSRIMENILKYAGSWVPSWLWARRTPQRQTVHDVPSGQVEYPSYTRGPELNTLFEGLASLERDWAGQDPVVQRGVREVWLHCIANDLFLMNFYTRRGFRLMRTIKNFYDTDSLGFDANFLLYTTKPSPHGRPPIDANFSDRREDGQHKDSCKLRTQLERIQETSPSSKDEAGGSMQDNSFISCKETTAPSFLWLTPSVYKDICHIETMSFEKCRREWEMSMSLWRDSATVQTPALNSIKEIIFTYNAVLTVLTVSWLLYKMTS